MYIKRPKLLLTHLVTTHRQQKLKFLGSFFCFESLVMAWQSE